MSEAAHRRRRARPVADAPIEPLARRAEELARGWLVALVEQAPLRDAPALLSGPVVGDGPALCAAALRALAADAALDELAAAAAPLASLGRAGGFAAVAAAVDALQDVLWAALRAQVAAGGGIGGVDPELVAELAGRLAYVCAHVRDAAITPARGAEPAVRGGAPPAPPAAPERRVPVAPSTPAAARGPDVPLWRSALEEEVERARAAGTPLSLLLAELEDADRVIASASPDRAGDAFAGFVAALRSVLRGHDILVSEDASRAWVIARSTARAGAHALGARIAESVGESIGVGGVPLVASVGIAVLGEDGHDAEALVESAEEARFTASARGIEVSRRTPDHERA